MYLGIEIGGTKLQVGLGAGDGQLVQLWRGNVNPALGAEGIRREIAEVIPKLLESAHKSIGDIQGIGIGFGGPVDDTTRSTIVSHQIAGWERFPIVQWCEQLFSVPVVVGNDADVAGLAEARYGAGRGCSTVFYITVGSGIGGGLILNGQIHRGTGRGAAEIGHLRMNAQGDTLEALASGWGIAQRARQQIRSGEALESAWATQFATHPDSLTTELLAQAMMQGDRWAQRIFQSAIQALAEAICHVIALICPEKIILGGGVSLIGEEYFFRPLREEVATRVFRPFAGLTQIVPAQLGETVVVHGAIALADGYAKKMAPPGHL